MKVWLRQDFYACWKFPAKDDWLVLRALERYMIKVDKLVSNTNSDFLRLALTSPPSRFLQRLEQEYPVAEAAEDVRAQIHERVLANSRQGALVPQTGYFVFGPTGMSVSGEQQRLLTKDEQKKLADEAAIPMWKTTKAHGNAFEEVATAIKKNQDALRPIQTFYDALQTVRANLAKCMEEKEGQALTKARKAEKGTV